MLMMNAILFCGATIGQLEEVHAEEHPVGLERDKMNFVNIKMDGLGQPK